MRRNFPIVLLVVVAVSGIGVGMVSMWKWAALERMMEAEQTALKEKLAEAEATAGDLREQLHNLTLRLQEATAASTAGRSVPRIGVPEKVVAGTGTAITGAKEVTKPGAGNPLANAMQGLHNDPVMKEMIAKQQEVVVDQMFGPLLENLDLTDEEMNEFRDLLRERQVATVEQGFQLMGTDKTKDEIAELESELGEQQEAERAEILELIGEENFEKFDLYEKSQQERQQISSFKHRLNGTGLELTLEQEEALMSAMYEERTNFEFTTDLSAGNLGGAETLMVGDPEAVDQFIEETARLHETVSERAAEVLSPEQLAAFKQSQASFRSMQEFAMKMRSQMNPRQQGE